MVTTRHGGSGHSDMGLHGAQRLFHVALFGHDDCGGLLHGGAQQLVLAHPHLQSHGVVFVHCAHHSGHATFQRPARACRHPVSCAFLYVFFPVLPRANWKARSMS